MKSSSRLAPRIAAGLAICMQLALGSSASAAQDDRQRLRRPAPAKASAQCEQARQFAWFTRGLRHSDGDNEPLVPPEPPECMMKAQPVATAPGLVSEPTHAAAADGVSSDAPTAY